MQYKYIEVITENGFKEGFLRCKLTQKLFCEENFFIQAFWMPIKNTVLDKKVLLTFNKDSLHFALLYNAIDAYTDNIINAAWQKDAEKSLKDALHLIDDLMVRFHDQNDLATGIKSVNSGEITLNGRLPMRKRYFEKKYWDPIRKRLQEENPGVLFHLEMNSPDNNALTVKAECKKLCSSAQHKGAKVPAAYAEDRVLYLIKNAITDLAAAVDDAILDFEEAIKNR